MATASVVVFSFLLSTALSAPLKVHEFTTTLFHGEDFHIMLPSLKAEVTFKNGSLQRSPEVALMRGGIVVHNRAKLNRHLSHLIIDAVGEGDEGNYTVRNPENPEDVRRTALIVRDCSNEQVIKYGDNFNIPVMVVTPPITLEFKPSSVEANLTARPALILLTSTGLSRDSYQGRIGVSERYVTLSAVTGADEGSYSVRDGRGDIQRKVCLNVIERHIFLTLPYANRLKFNLILNSSLVRLYYTPNFDPTPRLLLEKGEFTDAREELQWENRLSMDGSWVFLEQVRGSDAGVFHIKDILDFNVSRIQLDVEPYKLETLYVAIIALLGLLVFLLLVCLLSCLFKVKKRAKRAAALEKLAKNAGKEEEGEAFRQVVKNITKLSEESKHSQADNTEKSQSTEVDIKGLEVSSKEVGIGNLETSDSGVGFNTALPLDTDTDVPDPMSESVAVTISAAPEAKPSPPPAAEATPSPPPAAKATPSPPPAAEAKPSPPPALEVKSSPVAETKTSPALKTKKTPDPPVEAKLDLPKSAEVKLSPSPSPEPKATPSPADPKPAPSPSPEPKPAAPKSPSPSPESKPALSPAPEGKPALSPAPESKPALSPAPESKPALSPAPEGKPALSPAPEGKPALSPAPEGKPALSPAPEGKPALSPAPEGKPALSPAPDSKSALTPTPEPSKPTTPEPITNGTPEPGLDSKASPDHADLIGSAAPKAGAPKTPEVELKPSGADSAVAEDSTTTT